MEAETVLVKQLCYIQTKMYSLYRKMTIYIIYKFLGSILKLCYIHNLDSNSIKADDCL